MLCVLDDGSRTDGEWHHIRSPQFVIGRTEGNLVLEQDNGLSAQHAEIVRRVVDGRYRSYLRDLNSTNGTFARVSKALLRQDQEFLIGSRRYKFSEGMIGAADRSIDAEQLDQSQETRGWQAVSAADVANLVPSMVEMTTQGEGVRLAFQNDKHLLGRDPKQCSQVIEDDLFVSPVHAHVYRKKNRWWIQNAKSLNGLWVRVTEIPLDSNGEFQLGEQRFLIRFP
jgi:pSer/pThr/pTyr-binding forkhead associated (FHA) protein